MNDHARVAADGVRQLTPNRFDIRLKDRRVIKVFLTDTYTFSESDYEQMRAAYPEVTCVVSASSWNHFTSAVQEVARADGVGTFDIGEFMGAIHYRGDAFLDYPGPRR